MALEEAWNGVRNFLERSPSFGAPDGTGSRLQAANQDDILLRLEALMLANDALSAALEAREEAELGRGSASGRGCVEESSPLVSALGLRSAATLPPLRRLDTALPPLVVLGHSPGIPLATARSAPEEPRRARRALSPPPLPPQTDSWEAATLHGRQRAAPTNTSEVAQLLRHLYGRPSTPSGTAGARTRVRASGVLVPFGPPRRALSQRRRRGTAVQPSQPDEETLCSDNNQSARYARVVKMSPQLALCRFGMSFTAQNRAGYSSAASRMMAWSSAHAVLFLSATQRTRVA